MSYFLKNFHKVVSYTYVLFYNLLFSLHIFWAVSILLGHYICLSVLVVGCEVAQSCPTLCNPMGCSLPGSSIHGIFQARVVEGIAISFFRGSSWPRDWTWVFHIVGRRFYRLSHRLWLIPSMVLLHSRHLNKQIWSTNVFLLKTQMQLCKA